MSKNPTGTIFLPTLSAIALWHGELTGQFSDGMWENSRPMDHYKFWCGLKTCITSLDPHVITSSAWMCTKRKYNLSSLIACVGERMVKIGRMGVAMAKLNLNTLGDGSAGEQAMARAASYMPATLEEWHACRDGVREWEYGFIGRYMADVPRELAAAYYAAEYTVKDLRNDLKLIKAAMATV